MMYLKQCGNSRAHAEYVVFQFDIPSLHCVVGMAARYIGRRTFFCSRGRVGGASIYHFEICHCPFFLDIGVFRYEESSDNHCGTD